ncbi:hypothetical protein [Candidatus Avelusimicrobium aviculae]|uniref:hypothetical protein n=1 Tax=Candidatus Avelusimicrobium aviculae TaxID=3416206 RepID=UPI003D0F24EC
MEHTLILLSAGFVVCFVLLFWFTAKYRAALAGETDFDSPVEDLTMMTVSKPAAFPSRASILGSLQNTSALEMADLKEKVKDLHYRLEEMKTTDDKTLAEMAKQMGRLEQRLTTFEQEYITKLQPTLLSLIEELENMKVDGEKEA